MRHIEVQMPNLNDGYCNNRHSYDRAYDGVENLNVGAMDNRDEGISVIMW